MANLQNIFGIIKNFPYFCSMKERICFLADSIFSYGGVQRVTAVIARQLAKDYDVIIVTFDKEADQDTSLYGLDEADIHYRFFDYPEIPQWKELCCKAYSLLYRKILPQNKLTSMGYAHSSFPAEKKDALADFLKAGGYDTIIGVHAPLAARLACCRRQLEGVRLIGWIHNSYQALFSKESLYIGKELKVFYELQLQQLHTTVVLSQVDAHKYSFPTKVIYNPLTLIPGTASVGNTRRFLAVGRFSRQHKGFDLLIKAFHIFAQNNTEWKLDIVGEGEEEPVYRELIHQYQLEDRVIIHPFTNDVQSYYSKAQIYVLSSRWEGFGLVLVEAMAHGLPIVSSDLPTSKEIMGDFALYFKNGDINELALRLEEATQINWKEKSAQAQTIAHRFDIENIISQWKALI